MLWRKHRGRRQKMSGKEIRRGVCVCVCERERERERQIERRFH